VPTDATGGTTGAPVGDVVGDADGAPVGGEVGVAVGDKVGDKEGLPVGGIVGDIVGESVVVDGAGVPPDATGAIKGVSSPGTPSESGTSLPSSYSLVSLLELFPFPLSPLLFLPFNCR